MIKVLIFWGAAFLAFFGSIVVWVTLPPKFTAQAVCDEGSRTIRCIVSVARSLGLKIRLTSIWIPVEYLRALGASPPRGFKETARLVPLWLYDNAKREVVIWNSRLELPKDGRIELAIPAAHPKAISGTMQFYFECWGIMKVGCSGARVDVPLNSDEA
jgi:hypothetical protein